MIHNQSLPLEKSKVERRQRVALCSGFIATRFASWQMKSLDYFPNLWILGLVLCFDDTESSCCFYFPFCTGLFDKWILFLTVSASPNLEDLRSLIKRFLDDGYQNRKLVILDDVWTKESLDMLMFKIPGATTLVVSRFNLAGPTTTYNVELLKEDEAMPVFCICAFGKKLPPCRFRDILVKQVIMLHFMPLRSAQKQS